MKELSPIIVIPEIALLGTAVIIILFFMMIIENEENPNEALAQKLNNKEKELKEKEEKLKEIENQFKYL